MCLALYFLILFTPLSDLCISRPLITMCMLMISNGHQPRLTPNLHTHGQQWHTQLYIGYIISNYISPKHFRTIMTKTRFTPFSLKSSLPSLFTISLNNTCCRDSKNSGWTSSYYLLSGQMMPYVPQEGMKRFTHHLMRLYGEIRGVPSQVPEWFRSQLLLNQLA